MRYILDVRSLRPDLFCSFLLRPLVRSGLRLVVLSQCVPNTVINAPFHPAIRTQIKTAMPKFKACNTNSRKYSRKSKGKMVEHEGRVADANGTLGVIANGKTPSSLSPVPQAATPGNHLPSIGLRRSTRLADAAAAKAGSANSVHDEAPQPVATSVFTPALPLKQAATTHTKRVRTDDEDKAEVEKDSAGVEHVSYLCRYPNLSAETEIQALQQHALHRNKRAKVTTESTSSDTIAIQAIKDRRARMHAARRARLAEPTPPTSRYATRSRQAKLEEEEQGEAALKVSDPHSPMSSQLYSSI